MDVRLRDEMGKGMKIPEDVKLIRQLSNVEYEFNNKTLIKLVDKEKIKAELGESPDIADSVALTFFEPVDNDDVDDSGKNQSVTSFMSNRKSVGMF
jgi:hypothetical protein